jgi:hypothetical protein
MEATMQMQWKTYRTRFLVKAKQLNSNLSFIDPLGRNHSGRKGDYLVESSDGTFRIAPRQIFEDIYVPMRVVHDDVIINSAQTDPAQTDPVRRKAPQPYRERRSAGTGFQLM